MAKDNTFNSGNKENSNISDNIIAGSWKKLIQLLNSNQIFIECDSTLKSRGSIFEQAEIITPVNNQYENLNKIFKEGRPHEILYLDDFLDCLNARLSSEEAIK